MCNSIRLKALRPRPRGSTSLWITIYDENTLEQNFRWLGVLLVKKAKYSIIIFTANNGKFSRDIWTHPIFLCMLHYRELLVISKWSWLECLWEKIRGLAAWNVQYSQKYIDSNLCITKGDNIEELKYKWSVKMMKSNTKRRETSY